MQNHLRFKLQAVKQSFLDDLRPKYVLSSLLNNKAITYEESLEILSSRVPSAQVEKLFDILLKKPRASFHYFIKALRKDEDGCDTYPWLADKVEYFINEECNNLNKKLANGGVPYQINYLLNREKKVNYIQNTIKQAAKKAKSTENRHWIVLFGPIGSGKSVLAVEAIRNSDLLENYFPDGVFWIQVGHRMDDEGIRLRIKRMYKFLGLDNEPHPSESIYDLTLTLRQKVIAHPKILLILDDVWCSKIIKAFDIGCLVLVTTKDKRILDEVSTFCSPIECLDDLEIDEIKKLFSLHVNCTPNELPDVVDDICQKCKGSPMVTSLIGNIMKNSNDETRWQCLNKRLNSGIDSAVRKRHTSRDEWTEKKKFVCLCLEELERSIVDLKTYFLDFAIFYRDFSIPVKVLEIIWNMSSTDVEDFMTELYYKSLVQIEKCGNDGYAYSIQSLCYEALQDMCSADEIQSRHEKFIENILRIGRSSDVTIDLSLIPDKNYIPYTLGYHLYNAKKFDLLEMLYFDLNFIKQKIRKFDVDDLLLDYHVYKDCFKNKNEVEMFISFVKRCAPKIWFGETDVVQLALFEPSDSIVYKRAKDIAKKNSGMYYDWCNKEENTLNIYNYAEKHVPDELSCAVFNFDASLLAISGEKLLIFSTETYEVVQELTGHIDYVHCCVFNSNGTKLITASDDKTIKVFQINLSSVGESYNWKKRASLTPFSNSTNGIPYEHDKSIYTYSEHRSPVLCCRYSSDDLYIISSDEDGIICVWELLCKETEYYSITKYKLHTSNSSKFCCFSNDNKLFGAITGDNVFLWSFENGQLLSTLPHDGILVEQFCFTNDEKYVISVHNNVVLKWNISTQEKTGINIGRKKSFMILSCCISTAGNLFACGTSSAQVIVLNLNSENVIGFLLGHSNEVRSIVFSDDDTRLLSGSSDRFIIHDITSLQDTPLIGYERNLSVQQNENIVISLSNYFNSLEVRRDFDCKLISATNPEEVDISACSLSHDCSEVVYGTKAGNVKVFNILTNISQSLLLSHSSQVNYILHSKCDLNFFTCSEDTTIKLWRKGSQPLVFNGHKQSVLMCVQFKSCDKLLSCSKDGTLRVWDTTTGKAIFVIAEGHGNQDITFCDISPREKFLASASVDGTVKVWNAENSELYRTFEYKNDDYRSVHPVRCCRFSPSRDILISGHDDGKIILWPLVGKNEPILFGTHKSIVHNIRFKGDGSQFLTISKTIKIWDMKGNKRMQTLMLPSSIMGDLPPSIWSCDNFDIIVTIINYILYVLKRIS